MWNIICGVWNYIRQGVKSASRTARARRHTMPGATMFHSVLRLFLGYVPHPCVKCVEQVMQNIFVPATAELRRSDVSKTSPKITHQSHLSTGNF